MAWPPPALPINRSNSLPMMDTHPQDHNAVNLAINDIMAKLGTTPQGTFSQLGPTVSASMDRVSVSNVIQGVSADGNLLIQTGSSVFTTNASGIGWVNFTIPYLHMPMVIGINGDTTIPSGVHSWPTVSPLNLVGFEVHAIRGDTGLPAGTGIIMRVGWIAIGRRT